MMTLPAIRQVPSPNYSPSLIAHDLFIFHMMEGGYAGSVAWLCRAATKAASHLAMPRDGREVTQLVPLQFKAWAECELNGRGVSLEIEGFTAQGMSDETIRAAAEVAAWTCRAYAIPLVWAEGGRGRGLCCHHDLGAAGGGHVDCCGVGDATWRKIMAAVKAADAALGTGPLPAWALHGAPAPHQVELPPNVSPEPSHGGASRNEPGDVVAHPTASGYPLGSIGDIQWRLRKAGANPSLGVDDVDGDATERAIAAFARAVGLPDAGKLTPALWAALEKATA